MKLMLAVEPTNSYRRLWETIRRVQQEQRHRQSFLLEDLSFFVYRSDTNAVLARGIIGYEEAKRRADQIRRTQDLPWNVVKFKAERKVQKPGTGAGQSGPRRFGISRDGKTFTNAYGQQGRMDYAARFNPSKGRRFRGYTDADGNYHDID